jgi:hypothetical protein
MEDIWTSWGPMRLPKALTHVVLVFPFLFPLGPQPFCEDTRFIMRRNACDFCLSLAQNMDILDAKRRKKEAMKESK